MRRLRCWCGADIKLGKREEMNAILDFDLFCSAECLVEYIKTATKAKTLITKHPSKVNYDFQHYDFTTKRLYRSFFEVWLARCFYKNNITFEYEPHSFFVGGRYYTPDFYIPEKEIYIECKGLWNNGGRKKVKDLNEKTHLLLLPSYFQKYLRSYSKKEDSIK